MPDAMVVSEPAATQALAALPTKEIQTRMTRVLEIQTNLMTEKVHFGTIPGTQKPTLYKAGAELLLTAFQIAAVVDPSRIQETPIYSAFDPSVVRVVRYRVPVQLVHQPTGVILGEAVGECSSDEDKYAWRKPVCDQEWNASAEEDRREVWKKGANGAYQQKQVRTHAADIANTVLQMAYKRGLIQATRVTLACSSAFEQDLEDMPSELREHVVSSREENAAAVQQPQRKSDAAPTATGTGHAAPASQGNGPGVGSLRVVSATPKENRNGKKYWLVKDSTGKLHSTYLPSLGEQAEKYAKAGTPLSAIKARPDGQFSVLEGFEESAF